TLIDVGVRSRIALEQIFGVADDLDGRGGAGQGQRQIHRDGDGAPDIDVALQRLEPLRYDLDVVRVWWEISEPVLAHRISGGRPAEAGDRVADPDLDRLHHATGGILDGALHRAGAAKLLRPRSRRA